MASLDVGIFRLSLDRFTFLEPTKLMSLICKVESEDIHKSNKDLIMSKTRSQGHPDQIQKKKIGKTDSWLHFSIAVYLTQMVPVVWARALQ